MWIPATKELLSRGARVRITHGLWGVDEFYEENNGPEEVYVPAFSEGRVTGIRLWRSGSPVDEVRESGVDIAINSGEHAVWWIYYSPQDLSELEVWCVD